MKKILITFGVISSLFVLSMITACSDDTQYTGETISETSEQKSDYESLDEHSRCISNGSTFGQ